MVEINIAQFIFEKLLYRPKLGRLNYKRVEPS
jgi:hypothetical protein